MTKEIARKPETRRALGRAETDPFRDLISLRDTISGMFDDFFSGRPLMAGQLFQAPSGAESWAPAVDIQDTPSELVVYAALPGIKKEDVSIEVNDNVLSLSGTCKEYGEHKEGSWLRREHLCGSFYRAFTLPANVKSDQVKASFCDGVLEIRLPKTEQAKPRKVDIQ